MAPHVVDPHTQHNVKTKDREQKDNKADDIQDTTSLKRADAQIGPVLDNVAVGLPAIDSQQNKDITDECRNNAAAQKQQYDAVLKIMFGYMHKLILKAHSIIRLRRVFRQISNGAAQYRKLLPFCGAITLLYQQHR